VTFIFIDKAKLANQRIFKDNT